MEENNRTIELWLYIETGGGKCNDGTIYELTPIKQSASVMITMFGGFGYTALLFIGYMVFPGYTLGYMLYIGIFIVVNVVAGLTLYIWLYRAMELCSIGMDWSSLLLHSSLKF